MFLFSRGPILTIEAPNSDKGKCTYEEKPTYAHLDRSALTRNWSPLEAYKYKWPQSHLDITKNIIFLFFIVWFA